MVNAEHALIDEIAARSASLKVLGIETHGTALKDAIQIVDILRGEEPAPLKRPA